MIKKLSLLIFAFIPLFGFSQVDGSEKELTISAEESNDEKSNDFSDFELTPNKDFDLSDFDKNKINEISVKLNTELVIEEEAPFSMVYNDGLKSPSELYKKKLNKNAVKSGLKPKKMDDQFLGSFKVTSRFVNIICRDHGYEDGDMVRIFVDGDVVVPILTLRNTYRRVKIKLLDGENRIDILALNQGESGPNTAEFQIYDDQKNLISANRWNLLKGVKATVVFVNQKPSKLHQEDKEQ